VLGTGGAVDQEPGEVGADHVTKPSGLSLTQHPKVAARPAAR
jgi:hypothetical protein